MPGVIEDYHHSAKPQPWHRTELRRKDAIRQLSDLGVRLELRCSHHERFRELDHDNLRNGQHGPRHEDIDHTAKAPQLAPRLTWIERQF